MARVVLNLETVGFTDEQFAHLCQANQDWHLERTAKGELVIMPPVGGHNYQFSFRGALKVPILIRLAEMGKLLVCETDSL